MSKGHLIFDTYRFPAETLPDGAVLGPHHFYVGGMIALFGFMFVWPYYPTAGATLTVLGTALMTDDVLSHAFGLWTPMHAVWAFVVRRHGSLIR